MSTSKPKVVASMLLTMAVLVGGPWRALHAAGQESGISQESAPAARDKEEENAISPGDRSTVENEWYVPTQDKKASLYVWEVGRGEPVIAVHGGFGAEHSYLYDAFRGLTDRFHVIFYDQRGSLRSPCKPEYISVDKHVDDIEALRRALKLERVTLLGHSMGTYLTMAYMARYAQHVANVVLVSALPADTNAPNLGQGGAKKLMERPEVERELSKVRQSGVQGDKLETQLWRVRFASVNLFHVERWRQMKGGQAFYNGTAGQAAAKTLPEKWNFADVLRKHEYPVTIIRGDHDFLDSGKYYSELAKAGKHLTDVVIKDAGHNIWVDEPKAFHEALLRGLTAKP